MSVPTKQRAVKVVEKGKVAVKDDAPVPSIGDDEILVKVAAVTINPTDWKHVDFALKPGDSTGSDFAGRVVSIGSNAQKKGLVNIGDDVAGFVRGGFLRSDNGAFQEYVVSRPEIVLRKPKALPYEDAAAAGGVGLGTAAQVLFQRLNTPFDKLPRPEPLLVWAGSTGVGLYTIKIAAILGYQVVATSSERNFELLKSLGASAVFSYRDADTPEKIKQWARSNGFSGIKKAIDNFSEQGSTDLVAESVDEDAEIVVLLQADQAKYKQKIIHTILYTALDPANEVDFKVFSEWNYRRLPGWFEEGKLQENGGIVPLRHIEGGLDAISEALDYSRQGKVSAEKLVLTIAKI